MSRASPLRHAEKSGSAGATVALGCAIPFGLIFICAGIGIVWMLTLRPLAQVFASSRWTPVDAVVLSSELVASKSSEGGDTYRIVIRYHYEWPPTRYESDRYDFSSGSTNVDVSSMREIVAAHPAGRRIVCLVDPADPSSAVIDRSPPLGVWFGAAFVSFPVGGFLVIYLGWRTRRESRQKAVPGSSATSVAPVGEVVLKPAEGRLGNLIALAGIALFWNSIVSVFVIIAVKEFGEGPMGWFLPVFLIPFVIIGLALLFGALNALSRLLAPRVELRLEPARLKLGDTIPFSWRLDGPGVQKLTIELVGREEATYQQGTSTTTDKSDFYRAVVFTSTDRLSLVAGRADIALPLSEVAPALAAKNNRLNWELEFTGEIPWRAGIHDRFALDVHGAASIAGPAGNPEPREFTGEDFTLWTMDRFAPGETLVCTLTRKLGAKSEPVTLRLGWFTEGKASRDSDIVWSESLPDFTPGSDRSFEVPLPSSAPWSFTGKLVAVEWRLEVVDSKQNTLLEVPLTIAPGGLAVRLHALPERKPGWKDKFARLQPTNLRG